MFSKVDDRTDLARRMRQRGEIVPEGIILLLIIDIIVSATAENLVAKKLFQYLGKHTFKITEIFFLLIYFNRSRIYVKFYLMFCCCCTGPDAHFLLP